MAVDPSHPNIILATMLEDPTFNDYVPQNIYYSQDYGQTFDIYEELEDFPIKNIDVIKFNPDGSKLYIGPRCSSLYSMDNPFDSTDTTTGGATTSGGSSGSSGGDGDLEPDINTINHHTPSCSFQLDE